MIDKDIPYEEGISSSLNKGDIYTIRWERSAKKIILCYTDSIYSSTEVIIDGVICTQYEAYLKSINKFIKEHIDTDNPNAEK